MCILIVMSIDHYDHNIFTVNLKRERILLYFFTQVEAIILLYELFYKAELSL